jgi:PAS domain S-box-containing protein
VTSLSSARAIRGLKSLEGALLQNIDRAVIATEMNGAIIFWNPAAETLYGWKADEVLGRNIMEVTPTSQSRDAALAIMDQLGKGQSWQGKFEVRHKDGRWFSAQVTDTPLYDEDGATVAIMGTSEPAPTDDAQPRTSRSFAQAISRAKGKIASAGGMKDRSITDPAGKFVARIEKLFAPSSAIADIGLALLIFSVAVLARVALDQVVPDRLPYITFFPAVLAASFFCSAWAGLAVLLASAVTGAFWTDPLQGGELTFRITLFTLFAVIGGSVLAAVLYLKDILRRLRQRDEQLALINREMKHRIKNLFAIMSSVCVQTLKSSESTEAFTVAITGRINAVASAQDVLSVVASEGFDLRTLVETLVRPVAPSSERLKIEGPSVKLPSDATTPFALVLHELATNALKHGAWRLDAGRVSIEWRVHENQELDFSWRENDALPSAPPVRQGLGSVLIKQGLNGATVDHQINSDGLHCRIRLPLRDQ